MAALNLVYRKCIFFTLVILFFACEKPDERPVDILSHEKMVKVLSEVYIAEQKVSSLGLGDDSAQAVFGIMKKKIFESTDVSDSAFKKSMDFYMERPKEFEQIYSVVVDSLQLREQRTSQ